ncbi:MAG TPA: hypothetical protein VMM77_12995 [Gemmatimonadaceae bacterium]|nr:hypothetical protein [Gemmatimonadaceae bacterium]
MRRAILCIALAATALTPVLEAQEPAQGSRFPRRYLFSLLGAALGTAVGGSYIAFQGQQQPGNCGDPSCVVAVTVIAGSLIGYMIGREFDDLHALRYRGGAPLDPRSISAGLSGDATVLSVEDDRVAVGGSAGVQMFRSTPSALRADGRRAAGVRGIAALDLAQPGALALGSVTGLYLFPPTQGPGTLVRPGEIGATVTTVDRVFLGGGSMVESAPLSADTSRLWPGVDVGARVRDLEVDLARNILWALTDSAVVTLRIAGDSLEKLAAFPLVQGRALALEQNRIAVALGEQGVMMFDATDLTALRQTGAWAGARFAYDLSLAGARLFVAAGPEGLYVLEVSGGELRVLGLARELGFTVAVASFGSFTYVLDRSTNSVRRIESEFQ